MIAAFFCGGVWAQCPSYLTFNSQQDIDSFAADYPGCTELTDNLVVYDYSNQITNLDGLSVLTSIAGDLRIEGTNITNIEGLSNLNFVGGNVEIYKNNNLTSLTGLENLNTIVGDLIIGRMGFDDFDNYENQGNAPLNNLTALGDLDSLGGNLSIGGNNSLTNIGLSSLDTIWGNVDIYANDALSSFSGLNNLAYIAGDFNIGNLRKVYTGGYCDFYTASEGNDALTNFNGLSQLHTIEGSFSIAANASLIDFEGLNSLTFINETFQVYANHQLVDFAGLTALEIVGSGILLWGAFEGYEQIPPYDNYDCIIYTYYVGNNTLNSLAGLDSVSFSSFGATNNPNLSVCNIASVCNHIQNGATGGFSNNAFGCNDINEIALACGFQSDCPFLGDVTFSTQEEIDSFSALYPNCTEMEGLNIRDDVSNLDGLAQLTRAKYLHIINTNISNLQGLNNLSTLDDVYIYGNDMLQNLTGLDSLRVINENLGLYGNDALQNLIGLESLDTIRGTLGIGGSYSLGNAYLENLTGLENLDFIGGSLVISGVDTYDAPDYTGNQRLKSIAALSDLNFIGESITITYNSQLNLCNTQGICDHLQNDGAAQIFDNAPNCNSPAEVEIACMFPVECSTDIIFYFQEQIDDFAINNPECTEILGNLQIAEASNGSITSLSGLSQITSIGGDLSIYNNYILTSLEGLDNLSSIGEDLYIYNNDALTSLEGLENINSILGGLTIRDNDNLSLCGNVPSICNYLENVGTAYISDNAPGCNTQAEVEDVCTTVCPIDFTPISQQEVDDFSINYPNCTQILGDFDLSLANGITNLDGLSQVTSIGGWVNLSPVLNSVLVDITGLQNLTTIGGNLTINSNPYLSSLSGLDNITFIGANLDISNNLQLSICDVQGICNYLENSGVANILNNAPGCDTQAEVEAACTFGICPTEDIILNSQQQIDNFANSYPGCTEILGNLEIINISESAMYVTTSLSGLSQITSIAENLIISNNNALENLEGLSNITSIGGLYIDTNIYLDSLEGLNNIDSISGNLSINNNFLHNLESLNNMTYIGGDLYISDNVLPSLEGLNNLSSVGGNLSIANNSALTSLEGLNNVTSTGGDLSIYNNYILTSLEGLNNVNSIQGSLIIQYNENLSLCGNVPSICNHLLNGGTATINNNAPGCNSRAEVEDACIFLPIEMTAPLRVYLNNQTAILTWRTNTETNNAGFEIQRSKDGINWEKIAWQVGQGTSTTSHTYTHRDTNPLSGTSYYRLKQVDFDGSFAYSDIVSLSYTGPVADIFPNPTGGIFHVKGIPQGTYQIHDTAGRTIQSGNMKNNLSINISQETQGVYFISIQIENEIITKRIIKM